MRGVHRTLLPIVFFCSSFLIPSAAFAAVGIPFGGRVLISVPCPAIPGALFVTIAPLGFNLNTFYVWAPLPLTLTFLSGPPTHIGQAIWGVANPGKIICAPGSPPGLLMQIIGTSLL